MTDELLARLVSRPDDDAPRLAYADHLCEKGDPRGEFIRAQIAFEKAGTSLERARQEVRSYQLLRLHGERWLAELGLGYVDGRSFHTVGPRGVIRFSETEYGFTSSQVIFRRGFVEQVEIFAKSLLDLGDAPLAKTPVRALHLKGIEDDEIDLVLQRLARSPGFEHLRSLGIMEAHNLGPAGLGALTRAPLFRQLEELRLQGVELATKQAGLLASSPDLSRLVSLVLSAASISPENVQVIANALFARLTHLFLQEMNVDGLRAFLPSLSPGTLTHLNLVGSRLAEEGARVLAGCDGLCRLASLALSGTEISDEGVSALAKSSNLGQLKSLSLAANDIGPDGAQALANSRHLTALTHLDLGGNVLGNDGTGTLATSPNLARLTSLDLSSNRIGEAGAVALADARQLAKLSELNFGANSVGPGGAAALAASPHLASLTSLNLYLNDIGDAGTAALAMSSYWGRLVRLQLNHNQIGDAGACALASSTCLPDLTILDLSGNDIGDVGADRLANSALLDQLACLDLTNNELGDETQDALEEAPLGYRIRIFSE